jgi:hypothetical protein
MGFEPTITFWAIHTFQACSFDHSDTSLNGAAKISRKACTATLKRKGSGYLSASGRDFTPQILAEQQARIGFG